MRASVQYLLAAGAIVLFVSTISSLLNSQSRLPTAASLASTCPTDTICDAADALDRSLALFPASKNPHSPITRLVSTSTAYSWLGVRVDDMNEASGEYEPLSLAEMSMPVWVVAILGDGVLLSEVFPVEQDETIPGMYFLWNATGAGLLANGGLNDSGPLSYSAVGNLVSQPIPIPSPTPFIP